MYFIRSCDRWTNSFREYAVLSLRLVLGIVFLYHGWPKLMGLAGTTQFVASLGFPLPSFFALVLALVEVLGGIALIIGLLTRWASLLLLVDMLFALFLVHLKNGFAVSNGGYELVLVLIGGLITLKILGAQKLSIDHFIAKR